MRYLHLTLDPYQALDLSLALEERIESLRTRIAAATDDSNTASDRAGLEFELERAEQLHMTIGEKTLAECGVRL